MNPMSVNSRRPLWGSPHWLLLMVLGMFAGGSHASIHCHSRLVTEGDPVIKLVRACGQPATGIVSLGFYDNAQWTYNFGPRRLLVRVVINDGTVERIDTLQTRGN